MPQYDLNLRDYWRVIRKRKFIVAFTVIAMGVFSWLFSLLWQPVFLYEATASIKVEKTGSITGLYVESVSWSQTDYMQTQAAMIKSYLIMEIAGKKLGLIPQDLPSEELRANKKYQNIILTLKNRVETKQEGSSDIINIAATSEDPKFSQQLANTTANVYKEQHLLDINKRTFEAKNFIEGQLKVVKERLENAEEAVRKFREDNRLISLSSQTSTLLDQAANLKVANERVFTSHQKIEETKKLLEDAKYKPLTSKTSFYIDEASSLYKALNDRLVQIMLERDTLLLTYTEEYPRVAEFNKQISEILASMKAQLLSQDKILVAEANNLRNKIDQIERQIEILPEKGLDLARLEEEVNVNKEVYTLLEKKYQESLIKEAEKIEEVQIVKPALEPTDPKNPPKAMAAGAVGILIGLILGVVFAFVVETFDTSIGAIEDVEHLLGVQVLGIIPHVEIQEIKAAIKSALQEKYHGDVSEEILNMGARLVSHFAPKTLLAESFRALRTNFNFTCLEKGIKTVVLTSSSPQEGKTLTVVNLAIAMAQAGNKVLLVDGDLRKPIISNIFGLTREPGLTDAILGNYDWREAIRNITDLMMGKMSIDDIMETPGMDNLHIMTSGSIPSNPADLINSDSISEFIKEARSEYDIVLIDSTPILAATDAAILGSKVDGVVLVYQVGRIGSGALKRAKAQLDNVKAKVMGVVLNGLKAELSPDFAGYDKYYYYTYGEESEKRVTFWGKLLSSIPGFKRVSHRVKRRSRRI